MTVEETLKYVVEIDTSRAEAKMQKVFAQGGSAQAAPGGGAPGRAPNAQEIQDGLARAAAGGNAAAANAWARIAGAGGKRDTQDAEPSEKEVGYTMRLLGKINSRVAAAGIAAMNFARSPGQFGAMAGVAMGGKTGVAVAALSTLTEGLKGVAEGLQNYSAPLFASMTKFGLVLESLKWKMGAELGEALSRFMDKIGKLAIAIEPIASALVKLLTTALEPVIFGLVKLAEALNVVIAALTVGVAWIDKKTGGAVGSVMQTIQNPQATGNFLGTSGIMDWLFGAKGAMKDWTERERTQYEISLADGNKGAAATADRFNALSKPDHLNKALNDSMEALRKSIDRLTGKISEEDMRYTAQTATIAVGLLGGGFKHGPQVPNLGLHGDAQPRMDGMANPAAAWIDRQRQANAVGGSPNVTPAGFPLPQANPVNMHFNEQIEVRASDEDRLLSELLRWRDDLMGRVRSAGDMRWFKLAAARGGFKAGMGV